MPTAAEVIIQTLAASGVKRVYGLPGDSLNGITDSLRKTPEIEWVHVRHEEVAAIAAGAEAHLTGDLVVFAGSCLSIAAFRVVTWLEMCCAGIESLKLSQCCEGENSRRCGMS